MPTQQQIIDNMINDMRLSEPSLSFSVGSPERRIIEAVAQQIIENQIDSNLLNGGLDIEAKVGKDLTNLLGLFGFGRQVGTKASGFLKLSRNTAAPAAIRIPAATQFLAQGVNGGSDVVFVSSRSVIMSAGSNSVIVPIECIQYGQMGNVPANSITSWNGTPIVGITDIINEAPIVGGTDSETDAEMKARFNAIGPFRNVAGTKDSYLSLAVATLSKKASVIGPVSKYKEYIQVPSGPDSENNGNGNSPFQYTTALSSNINAKHIYDNLPYHVLDDTTGEVIIYTHDLDFVMNLDPSAKNQGDAYREYQSLVGPDPSSTDEPTIYQPNVTFSNVYTGGEGGIKSISPNDILLFEYSYLSRASRNDYIRGISNCVDIYVDNSDIVLSNMSVARPGNNVPVRTFNTDPYSGLYYQNFRRKDAMQERPIPENIYVPVLEQPMIDLPETISTGDGTFIRGIHYWAIEDVTPLRGSVRARNGIEFASKIPAKLASDSINGPFRGGYITDFESKVAKLYLAIPDYNPGASNDLVNFLQNSAILTQDSQNTLLDRPAGTIVIENAETGDMEQMNYENTSITPATSEYGWTGSVSYGNDSLSSKLTAYATTAYVSNVSGFPNSGTVLIDNEFMSYASKTTSVTTNTTASQGTTGSTTIVVASASGIANGYNVSGTGIADGTTVTNVSGTTITISLGTTAVLSSTPVTFTSPGSLNGLVRPSPTEHLANADVRSMAIYNGAAYECITSHVSPIDEYTAPYTPNVDSTNWSQIGYRVLLTERGVNSTNTSNHIAQSSVSTIFDATDHILSVENYTYNGNIKTLQSSVDSAKQVTADALAHEAKIRYFKPDVTVMYSGNQNPSDVNKSIVSSLRSYFDSQYFGSIIQLSDVLQVVHNAPGVDNVKWSKDNLDQALADFDSTGNPRDRMVEVNRYGQSFKAALQIQSVGNGAINGSDFSSYLFYLSDQVDQGIIDFKYGNEIYSVPFTNPNFLEIDPDTGLIIVRANDEDVLTESEMAPMTVDLLNEKLTFATVTADNPDAMPTSENPYLITFESSVDTTPFSIVNQEKIIEIQWSKNSDFALGDDELISLPILQNASTDISSIITIRSKAQNTWDKV